MNYKEKIGTVFSLTKLILAQKLNENNNQMMKDLLCKSC